MIHLPWAAACKLGERSAIYCGPALDLTLNTLDSTEAAEGSARFPNRGTTDVLDEIIGRGAVQCTASLTSGH